MQLLVKYDPSDNAGQLAFHQSNAMYKLMVGALGSGKSAAGCAEGQTLNQEYPGNVGLIARRTMPDLKKTTMKTFFEFLPEPIIHSWNKTDMELKVKTSQPGVLSTVYFGPLDELERWKSLELGWFFVDELNEITEDMWLVLCGRLRIMGPRLCAMGATNPTSRKHWIYRRWVVDRPKQYELFHGKTEDNKKHLPATYIQNLLDNYPQDYIDRYVKGLWGNVQEGDPVFTEFKQDVHVREVEYIKELPMMRGWDFGWKRPCVVFGQVDDEGRVRIYHTILGEDEDLYSFAGKVQAFSRREYSTCERWLDYCDIAGKKEQDTGKPSIKVLHEKRIFPLYKFSYPEKRAEDIKRLLNSWKGGAPMFLIHPRNDYLIEGFLGGYCVDAQEKIKKDKYYDHGFDAMGYMLYYACGHATEDVKSDIVIAEPKWNFG